MQERRTRISGKLKKLQDLVPNMDKVVIDVSFKPVLLNVTENIWGLDIIDAVMILLCIFTLIQSVFS